MSGSIYITSTHIYFTPNISDYANALQDRLAVAEAEIERLRAALAEKEDK